MCVLAVAGNLWDSKFIGLQINRKLVWLVGVNGDCVKTLTVVKFHHN